MVEVVIDKLSQTYIMAQRPVGSVVSACGPGDTMLLISRGFGPSIGVFVVLGVNWAGAMRVMSLPVLLNVGLIKLLLDPSMVLKLKVEKSSKLSLES